MILKLNSKSLEVLSLALLFSVSSLAQTAVKLRGNIQNASTFTQFSSPYFNEYIEVTAEGKFEIDFIADEFPIPLEILFANAKGRVQSESRTIWLVAETNTLQLDAAKNPVTYALSPVSPDQVLSEQFETANKTQLEQLLRAHPASAPALYVLNKRKREFSPAQLQSILAGFPEEAQLKEYYLAVATYAAAKKLKSPKKGDVFQSFTAKDALGKTIEIQPKNENYRLLALLSPGCYHSLRSIELLNGLQAHYGGKIELVGIWSASGVSDLTLKHQDQLKNANWAIYWDAFDFASEYFATTTSPTFLLVNQEGKIVKVIDGLKTDQLKTLPLP